MRRVLQAVAVAAVALIVAAIIGLFVLGCGCGGDTWVTASRFSSLRADHTQLRAFLKAMPKGADLHVHLSGAVYAEDLLRWGKDKQPGLCIRQTDLRIVAPPCDPGETYSFADALGNQTLYDRLVNAYSMRSFVPSGAVPTGHDQFFATFSKVGELTGRITALMIAERLHHYATDSVQHTELMATLFGSSHVLQYVYMIRNTTDPARRLEIMRANHVDALVKESMRQIDAASADVADVLGCATANPDAGCNVTYRFIAQVNRNNDEANVFVQTALAAALVRADPRVAGLNFVGPEDYRVAREDYRKHMKAVGFLTRKTATDSEVPVALHAGELWLGLVPPDDLTFHIREAVEVAGAKRIGHGVALAYERRSDELLATMRRTKVAVEINLTSNDVILGVRGKDHPLTAYRAANVPLVLSTDDAGISRIDLTNEYFRAARDYPLDYRALKSIARASIEHAFLGDTAKSIAFRQLDEAFGTFERDVVKKGSLLENAWALVTNWWR